MCQKAVPVFRLSGRKRRIFKMAPLHHHFEMSGWQENQIVVRFWIIQFTFAVVGFVLYYFTLYNDAV